MSRGNVLHSLGLDRLVAFSKHTNIYFCSSEGESWCVILLSYQEDKRMGHWHSNVEHSCFVSCHSHGWFPSAHADILQSGRTGLITALRVVNSNVSTACDMEPDDLKALVSDRSSWRELCKESIKDFELRRVRSHCQRETKVARSSELRRWQLVASPIRALGYVAAPAHPESAYSLVDE